MRSRPAGPWQTDPTAVVDLYMDTWTWKPRQIELIELRTAEHFVARISSRAKSAPSYLLSGEAEPCRTDRWFGGEERTV